MSNLWYAELAGTILMWVEEVPDDPLNPPFSWQGTMLRRPLSVALASEDRIFEFIPDVFREKTLDAAMEGATKAILNSDSPFINEYAHRVGELHWTQWKLSDQEWEQWKTRFMTDGRTE
jgi:hypothetical protein